MSSANRPGHPQPKSHRDTGRDCGWLKLAGDDGVPLARAETWIALDDGRPDITDGTCYRDRSCKLNHGPDVQKFDRVEYGPVGPRYAGTEPQPQRAAQQVEALYQLWLALALTGARHEHLKDLGLVLPPE